MAFKKGDVVEAVEGTTYLQVGKKYIVLEYQADKWMAQGGAVRIEGKEVAFYARRFKLAKPEPLVFAVGAQVERIGINTEHMRFGRKYIIETVYQDELGGAQYIKIKDINARYHVRGFKVVKNAPKKAFNRANWKPQVGEKVYITGRDRLSIGERMDAHINNGVEYTIRDIRRSGGEDRIYLKDSLWMYLAESLTPVDAGKPVAPPKPVVPPQPEDLRDELIQKQGNRGGLCSFAYEHPDGTRTFHISAPCHARLDNYGNNDKHRTKMAYNLPHQIYNLKRGGYSGKTSEENHNFAAEWVITESPWAIAFLTKDIKEAIEKGLFMDVEQNRNVIASACCALRSFMEFERADVFRIIKEAGYSGGAAFLIACAFGSDGLGNYMRKGMGGGHDVIVGSQSFKGWIKFFAQGFHTACGTEKKPFRTHHSAYRMAAACADEGMESLTKWFEQNVKGKTIGEGWDKKQVISKESLLEAAATIDKLIKGDE